MSKLRYLQGEFTHLEYLKTNDGVRRHRKHCVHYLNSGNCSLRMTKCGEVSRCNRYEEKKREITDNDISGSIRIHSKLEYDSEVVKPFESVIYVPLDKVSINNQFKGTPPKRGKVDNIIEYYNEHLELDRPIWVECPQNRRQYSLVDGYARYYAAKRMGLKEIPIEMGTKEEIANRNKLRNVGALVYNKKSKEVGEVVKFDLKKVTIKYDSGKEVLYDIAGCISSGTILSMDYD